MDSIFLLHIPYRSFIRCNYMILNISPIHPHAVHTIENSNFPRKTRNQCVPLSFRSTLFDCKYNKRHTNTRTQPFPRNRMYRIIKRSTKRFLNVRILWERDSYQTHLSIYVLAIYIQCFVRQQNMRFVFVFHLFHV